MNALTSYFRHLIVTGLLLAIERFRLPIEGAEDAANVIALAAIGTGTWLIVKYAPEWARKIGLLAALVMILPGLQSCAEYPMTLRAETDQGHLSYSAKRGLVLTVDQRSRK